MPFVIYGTRAGKLEDDLQGQSVAGQCGNCGQQNMFRPVKQRRFFSLFWIPLIPFNTRHMIQCPNCMALYEVKK